LLPVPDLGLAPVPGQLPDEALRSESAIDAGIDTFAAVIDIQAFTAFPAITGLMFLADGQGLT